MKTTIEKERVAIEERDLPRFREMTRKLFTFVEKHQMREFKEGGRRHVARELVFSYLKLPQDTSKGAEK